MWAKKAEQEGKPEIAVGMRHGTSYAYSSKNWKETKEILAKETAIIKEKIQNEKSKEELEEEKALELKN